MTADDLFDDIDGMDDQMLSTVPDTDDKDSDVDPCDVDKFLFDENSKGEHTVVVLQFWGPLQID